MASAQLRKLLKRGVFPESRQAFDSMLADLTPETMQGIDEALDAASGDKKLADAVSEAQSYLMTDPDDPSVGMQLLAEQLYGAADPPKKTGVRGKKDTPNETIEGNNLPQSSADKDALAPVPEEKPKRGRGRPKKGEVKPLDRTDENVFMLKQGITEDRIRKLTPAERSATLDDLGFQPEAGSTPAPNQAAGSDAMQRAREMVSQQMAGADPDGSEIDPTALGAQMVDAADLPTEPPQADGPAMDMSRLSAASPPPAAPSPTMDMSRLSAAAPERQPAMDMSRLAAATNPPAGAPQSNMISMLSRYLRDQNGPQPPYDPFAPRSAVSVARADAIPATAFDEFANGPYDPFAPRDPRSAARADRLPESAWASLMAPRLTADDWSSAFGGARPEPTPDPFAPRSTESVQRADQLPPEAWEALTGQAPDATGGGGPPVDPPRDGKEPKFAPVANSRAAEFFRKFGGDYIAKPIDSALRNAIPLAGAAGAGAAAFRMFGGNPQESADAQAARMQELEEARQRVRESLGRINVSE